MKLIIYVSCVVLLVLLNEFNSVYAINDGERKVNIKGKKKSLVDLDDADVERLFDEWEENDPDGPLPDDELPPYLQKKRPSFSMDDIKGKGTEGIKALNKKNQAIMIFATVSDNPTQAETEQITSIWQSSLFNANYQVTRYLMDDKQAIFMVNDGATAWEIKDFLIKQDRCLEVTIDQETFPGVNFPNHKKAKKEL